MRDNTAQLDKPEETMHQPARHNQDSMPGLKNAQCIQHLHIEPSDHNKIPLGKFDEKHLPKGFLVELQPDAGTSKSTVTVITRLPIADRCYAYFLHITNHGLKPVDAGIWRL